MSQLNNNKKAKNTLYFLLLFTICCIAITIYCIKSTLELRKNTDEILAASKPEVEIILEDEIEVDTSEEIKDIEPVSLSGKYLTNGITEKTITENKEKLENSDNYKFSVKYPEISGLKDKQVQNKINNRIEKEVNIFKEKFFDDTKYYKASITAEIMANYSDVLSISIYCSYTLNSDNSKYLYERKGLNFRLDTGASLRLEDLFTPDANVASIFEQSAYKEYAWHYLDIDSMDSNFENIDYGKIEVQMRKIMAKYSRKQKC